VGEIFGGRYELVEPIADGGMGSVWRVVDHRDGSTKAAKLLRQRDAASLLRFIREQATRIHHPHVVTPLGWVGEDDSVLFTMPLVRGGSVATLIGDFGALPEQWVAVLLEQTLAGLDAVHATGVVHRDVKPANLLLEPTGRERPHARLTDFGIAVAAGEPRLTRGMVALGTPGYLAPEQEQGADPDPRQDLYAVGITGLHMLTGAGPPHAPSDLPDTDLVRVLLEAADPDPERRPSTAAALIERLRATVGAEPWDPGEVEVLDQLDLGTTPPPTPPPSAEDAGPTTPALPTAERARPDIVRPSPLAPALLVLGGVLLLVAAAILLL